MFVRTSIYPRTYPIPLNNPSLPIDTATPGHQQINQINHCFACEKIVCHISIHCCCLYDSLLCGSRNVPARISRILAESTFSASMDFQSRTANRIRLASMEITPEYI